MTARSVELRLIRRVKWLFTWRIFTKRRDAIAECVVRVLTTMMSIAVGRHFRYPPTTLTPLILTSSKSEETIIVLLALLSSFLWLVLYFLWFFQILSLQSWNMEYGGWNGDLVSHVVPEKPSTTCHVIFHFYRRNQERKAAKLFHEFQIIETLN